MTLLLKDRFDALLSDEVNLKDSNACWQLIESAYSGKRRHYHDLSHLENLFLELDSIHDQINNWKNLSWSVFFHDIIYNVRRQDNEELSAEEAVKWLTKFNLPIENIKHCQTQIIATKSHDLSNDNDTNLFTDADLSVLGKNWKTYERYFKNIRKEYRIYPNIMYKPARKKVLQHFLKMPRIYKTDTFRDLYEKQARKNIELEMERY